jgi:hypothetical protein
MKDSLFKTICTFFLMEEEECSWHSSSVRQQSLCKRGATHKQQMGQIRCWHKLLSSWLLSICSIYLIFIKLTRSDYKNYRLVWIFMLWLYELKANKKSPTARSIQSLPHPIGSPYVSHSVFLLQQGATWWYTSHPPHTTVVSRSETRLTITYAKHVTYIRLLSSWETICCSLTCTGKWPGMSYVQPRVEQGS